MTIKEHDIFWSCINCGYIWATPKPSEPSLLPDPNDGKADAALRPANTFDYHMQQLRTALEGIPARLGRLGPQLERIPVSVLIVNDEARYVAVNDLACALTGYSRAEVLQKRISDLTAANETIRYTRLWDSFIGSMKQHGVYNIVRKGGDLVRVEYVAYTDLAPGIHISFIRESV